MARLADAWSQAQKEEGGGSWRVLEQAVRESLAIVARAPVAEPNAMTEAEKYAQAQGLAQWMADNPLPATAIGRSMGWEMFDSLCLWASNSPATIDCAMQLVRSCLRDVRKHEVALMAVEKLYEQREALTTRLSFYTLQFALISLDCSHAVLEWLVLVKDFVFWYLSKHSPSATHCEAMIVDLLRFVSGVGTKSERWCEDITQRQAARYTEEHTEMEVYLGSLVLFGLEAVCVNDKLVLPNMVQTLCFHALDVLETIGFSLHDLFNHPLRTRAASWFEKALAANTKGISSHNEKENKTAMTQMQAEVDRLFGFLRHYPVLGTYDVIAWKEAIADSTKFTEQSADESDDVERACVRGMTRKYITHRFGVLSTVPPLRWSLVGSGLIAAFVHPTVSGPLSVHMLTNTAFPLCMALLNSPSKLCMQIGVDFAHQTFRSLHAFADNRFVFVDCGEDDPPLSEIMDESLGVAEASMRSAIVAACSKDVLGMPQLIINVMTQHPDRAVRSNAHRSLALLVRNCELQSRYRLLRKLVDMCPYPAAVGLLLDIASSEAHATWPQISSDSSPFASPEMVALAEKYLTSLPTTSSADLAQRLDEFTASTGLLRRILLYDQAQVTGVYESSTRERLRLMLSQALAHVQRKVHRAERKHSARALPDPTRGVEAVDDEPHVDAQPSMPASFPVIEGVVLSKFYLLEDSIHDVLRLLDRAAPPSVDTLHQEDRFEGSS